MREKLDLQIISKNYMDCLDVLLYSAAKWLGKDCEMQYLEYWGFRYDMNVNSKLISEKIGCGRGEEFEYLEKYHGMSIKSYEYEQLEFKEFINEEISLHNMPILMQVDCYWASWIVDIYQQKHMNNHYILVLGYDDQENRLFIVDNQEAQQGLWCSYEEIQNALQKVYCIRDIKKEVDFIDPKEAIKKMLGKLKPYEYLGIKRPSHEDKLKCFLYDMQNSFELSLEVEPYLDNLTSSRMVNAFNDIAKGRIKAALSLEYIMNHSGLNELASVINCLSELCASWKRVFGIFVKYCYMRDNQKIREHVVNKISEIIINESIAIELLEKCYYGTENEITHSNLNNKLGEKYNNYNSLDFTTIDLNDYFNNAGCFGEVTQKANLELSNPNRYLQVRNYDGVEFINYNLTEDCNDNIVCEGQFINTDSPIGSNSYLMLLMCSEFTNCETEVTLRYKDGDSEVIKVGVTCWLYPEPEYNDLIVIEGTPVQIEFGEISTTFCYNFPGHIYGSMYKINKKNTVLTQILLPDSINVHIFGITIAENNHMSEKLS